MSRKDKAAPVTARTETICSILERRAKSNANDIAFSYVSDGKEKEVHVTFAELYASAVASAQALVAHGAVGERVLLLFYPGIEFVAAFLGCLYAGAIAVPLPAPTNRKGLPRLEAVARDSTARFAMTGAAEVGRLKEWAGEIGALNTLTWIDVAASGAPLPDNLSDCRIAPDSVAFLQYTSGSTGDPKGVVVTHGNLIDNERRISRAISQYEGMVAVSWLPAFHDMGLIGGILGSLYGGCRSILISPSAVLKRPAFWLETISRFKAEVSGGPNFAYELCLRSVTDEQMQRLRLDSWRLAFNGAEPVRETTLRRFAERFSSAGFRADALFPCYGLAEATLFVTGGHASPDRVFTAGTEALERNCVAPLSPGAEGSVALVPCGHVDEGETVVVDPANSVILPPLAVGEIWLRNASVAAGYWQKPQETNQTFCATLAGDSSNRYLRTGDLGFIADGTLYITGRLKDVIIINGRNIYPQDLEHTAVASHPALTGCSAAAFGYTPSENAPEAVAIVIELPPRIPTTDLASLVDAVNGSVSETFGLRLASIALVKAGHLPKTSSGKVQRSRCRQLLTTGQLPLVHASRADQAVLQATNAHHAKHGQVQAHVVERVAALLRIAPTDVDVDKPLANYGFSSIDAVTLAGELEQAFGQALPPTLCWDHPTIAAIAEHIDRLRSSDSEIAVPTPAPSAHDAIAVIGIGCRFPGADGAEAFWDMLLRGECATGPRPLTDGRAAYPAHAGAFAGLVDKVDEFDSSLFAIAPTEAIHMDPQQRLLLEVAWCALEDAGYSARCQGTSTGVFVGISSNDYSRLSIGEEVTAYSASGNAKSIAANRLSYCFDLKGPSLAIDTACSSSLVALHQASHSLFAGECDMALAGGVNVLLSDDIDRAFTNAGMLASDGRCKTFDDSADGYVRGEGCGIVVLRRLSDALRDGDRILGILRGSAVNQDGRSNGLTAPNGLAQRAVIKQALKAAGVASASIGYVEAHGTGTALGDPVEMRALQSVFDKEVTAPCAVGSVKANIGHLEAAAGIAGFIKALLAVNAGVIPPHINFRRLNRHISLTDSRLCIPTTQMAWPSIEGPRRATVASFGFGGTNAYVVVEQAPPAAARTPHLKPNHLLALSAHSREALLALCTSYRTALSLLPDESLPDFCYSSNTTRSHMPWRVAVTGRDGRELSVELETAQLPVHRVTRSKAGLVFMFTGQGAQYPKMAAELFQTSEVFRAAIQECRDALIKCAAVDLLALLYGDAADLEEPRHSQPMLFAVEYALSRLWASVGVTPAAVIGHSLGEYVAAVTTGILQLDEAIALVFRRAELMASTPEEGSMLNVLADEARIRVALGADLGGMEIAAYNADAALVLSGPASVAAAVSTKLSAAGLQWKPLRVSHGFHSRLMESCVEPLIAHCRALTLRQPAVPFACTLDGRIVEDSTLQADYWAKQTRSPVRFALALNALHRAGFRHFVEIGPRPVLTSLARQQYPSEEGAVVAVPSLNPRVNSGDWHAFLQAAGELHSLGYDLDWHAFDRPYRPRRISLPSFPFQRQRYWLPSSRDPISTKRETMNIVTGKISTEHETAGLGGLVELFRLQTALLHEQTRILAGGSEAAPRIFDAPANPSARAAAARPAAVEDAPYDKAIPAKEIVFAAIEKVSGTARARLSEDSHLVKDLGFDSLMSAALLGELRKKIELPETAVLEALGGQLTAGMTVRELLRTIEAGSVGPQTPYAAGGNSEPPFAFEHRQLQQRLAMITGPNPFFRVHDSVANATTTIAGVEYTNFSTYNYLGLCGDPRVSAAAKQAIDRYGTSVSASRPISGERPFHGELEAELAEFLGAESAVVFLGGHATNETTIGHLFGDGDLILHDNLSHNSIIQGALLSGAARKPFPHNDWRALDATLSETRGDYRRVLIVIEGVYSMDGDIPDLPHFIDVKRRHNAILMVDEAHSMGTIGQTGRGVSEYFGLDSSSVDIWMGTLSKAFASCGGYIAGSREIVEYLKYTAPGFLFSVGMSPANACAALEALRILKEEPDRVSRLRDNARLFLSTAKSARLNTGASGDSPVIPIILGDSQRALALSEMLFRRGYNVQPVVYPAVEESQARLRFFVSSEHTEKQIRQAVAAITDCLGSLDGLTNRPMAVELQAV